MKLFHASLATVMEMRLRLPDLSLGMLLGMLPGVSLDIFAVC